MFGAIRFWRDAVARAAAAALAAATFAGAAHAQQADGQAPVVVELFTSQGCNTCPPADELLGRLTEDANVIALTLNVDYWNDLGWPDRFSKPEHTERQRAYQRSFGSYTVYTPQMVIQGKDGLVGSHERAVRAAIARQASRSMPAAVSVSHEGERLTISLEAAAPFSEPATIWVVGYDGPHDEQIGGGENSGHTITYHNVTRDMRDVGAWDGSAPESIEVEVDMAMRGYAVLVQQNGVGPILGAARIVLADGA